MRKSQQRKSVPSTAMKQAGERRAPEGPKCSLLVDRISLLWCRANEERCVLTERHIWYARRATGRVGWGVVVRDKFAHGGTCWMDVVAMWCHAVGTGGGSSLAPPFTCAGEKCRDMIPRSAALSMPGCQTPHAAQCRLPVATAVFGVQFSRRRIRAR